MSIQNGASNDSASAAISQPNNDQGRLTFRHAARRVRNASTSPLAALNSAVAAWFSLGSLQRRSVAEQVGQPFVQVGRAQPEQLRDPRLDRRAQQAEDQVDEDQRDRGVDHRPEHGALPLDAKSAGGVYGCGG